MDKKKIQTVLTGYFKVLVDDGDLRKGSVGPNDIEYLTNEILGEQK